VNHVMMDMMHDVTMMHHVMATFGLHRDCFGPIGGGLSVSRSLLGARRGSLCRSGRLLRRVGGGLSALR
jgi:hypothetical protein